MLYKIQRGKWTALVSARIVQLNLIVLSYGRIWYGLEDFGLLTLHFNTQETVIDMVWFSHSFTLHKLAWWRNSMNQDTQINKLNQNWKIYSDRPVFTPEKRIHSIFTSREGTWRWPIQANYEALNSTKAQFLDSEFFENFAKAIWNMTNRST